MWNLPPVREGYESGADLIQRRADTAEFQKSQPIAAGVTIGDATIGGVSCLVCEASAARATILYLHGGGFRLGRPPGWAGFASRLAVASGARIVVPDYRLTPEHPFPAGLHDAASVYDALMREEPSSAIFVGGDSAGGGLAASLAVACRGQAPLPRGLILLSPWVDLTVRASTFDTRAGADKLFSGEGARMAAAAYLQGVAPEDPLASPLFADLAGFPPTLLFAGGDEVLLGDGVAFAERLALAGITVEAHFVTGMQHVWPTLFPDLAESYAALEAMAAFVRRF